MHQPIRPTPMADNHSPVKTLLTTGFGTGFSPIAPGTAGSLATCILFIILLAIPTINHTLLRIIIGTVAIASIAGCIGLGSYMELRFGKKDPGQCTLDEWAGQAITLCAIPLGDNWQQHIIAISAAFAAFRFFD